MFVSVKFLLFVNNNFFVSFSCLFVVFFVVVKMNSCGCKAP